MEELTNDLRIRTTTNWTRDGEPPENTKLAKRMHVEAENQIDEQVMMAMLRFNRAVLKTNLHQDNKAALSFRLDPKRLQMEKEWPLVPFGLFYVIASDFQGFHIRFKDVSRGGIRLIRSRNRSAFTKNITSQFAENYGLAFTQNMKNKDIPEFGSKGTILLNEGSQLTGFLSFKRYVSALLDLMLPGEQVVDNYGKQVPSHVLLSFWLVIIFKCSLFISLLQELLFLGPDEGTADMMEYAAYYAKSRNYPFWRSFTTGKPATMGGIPHDTYGTRIFLFSTSFFFFFHFCFV
jgi:glutamate dehydrogenase